MNVDNRNWWPQWPVMPPRLRLTAAATVVVGLSLYFQQEIWPHHPRAEPWGWLALSVLMQFGGIQLIKALWVWVGEYRGPRWGQLIVAGAVFLACFGMAMLLLALCVLTCFGLIITWAS